MKLRVGRDRYRHPDERTQARASCSSPVADEPEVGGNQEPLHGAARNVGSDSREAGSSPPEGKMLSDRSKARKHPPSSAAAKVENGRRARHIAREGERQANQKHPEGQPQPSAGWRTQVQRKSGKCERTRRWKPAPGTPPGQGAR